MINYYILHRSFLICLLILFCNILLFAQQKVVYSTLAKDHKTSDGPFQATSNKILTMKKRSISAMSHAGKISQSKNERFNSKGSKFEQFSPETYDREKIFFLELSGNYIPPRLSESSNREEVFQNYVHAYGASVGASLFPFRNNEKTVQLGLEFKVQYHEFLLIEENLDYFDQRELFNLYNTAVGLNIGIKARSTRNFQNELVLKAGIIASSNLEPKIELDYFKMFVDQKTFGKYAGLQLKRLYKGKIGYFFAARFLFDQKIETNFNTLFSVNGLKFDLSAQRTILQVGLIVGLF